MVLKFYLPELKKKKKKKKKHEPNPIFSPTLPPYFFEIGNVQ